MSLFGVLRLRLSHETAPNSAQDDEFNDENNFCDRTLVLRQDTGIERAIRPLKIVPLHLDENSYKPGRSSTHGEVCAMGGHCGNGAQWTL
jgi:hypothetical protein